MAFGSIRRIFFKTLVYLSYLTVFVVGLFWITYQFGRERPVIREPLVESKDSDKISRETLLRLSYLQRGIGRLFLNFPVQKAPGVIRIGCFGDSFTAGHEAKAGEDYPSQLQELFEENGFKNIEVINFGASAWGSHQSYLIWEEVGKRYGLDYVLMGPTISRPNREVRFRHDGVKDPTLIHSRYILEGGGLRRIDMPGNRVKEIHSNYTSFFPPSVVLKYDYDAPPVINYFSNLFQKGRVIHNPFYYSSLGELEEAFKIFEKIVEQIESTGTKVVVIDHMAGNLSPAFSMYQQERRFPYRAPHSHNGPLGNKHVAALYFAKMTGRPLQLKYLTTLPPAGHAPALKRTLLPLNEYDSVDFRYGDQIVGQLSRGSGDPKRSLDKVKNVLTIKHPSLSWLESVWIPVTKNIRGGQSVTLVAKIGKETRSIPLGKIELLQDGLGIGLVNSDIADRVSVFYEHFYKIKIDAEKLAKMGKAVDSSAEEGIFVENEKISSLALRNGTNQEGPYVEVPGDDDYLLAAAHTRRFSWNTVQNLDGIDLVLRKKGDPEVRLPFGQFEVSYKEINFPQVEKNIFSAPVALLDTKRP